MKGLGRMGAPIRQSLPDHAVSYCHNLPQGLRQTVR